MAGASWQGLASWSNMLLHVQCIFLGFNRVAPKLLVCLCQLSTDLPTTSKLVFLSCWHLAKLTKSSARGGVSYQVRTRVCPQTPKWLVFLCQGLASWSNHAVACLVYLSSVWQGVLQKCIGMCFCQFETELPIASKLAFLSCWHLPWLAKSSLKGWCILSNTYLGCVNKFQNGWCIYVRVQQVGPNMLLHAWCIFLGFSRVCFKNAWHVPLLVVKQSCQQQLKAGFSIWLALSKINREHCKGWCILSGTYQGVSTNSKMAGVSCQGLASWSNMLLHVWCIFLGFNRVAPKLLVCLCQLSTELPTTSKWLFYLVGTQQD